MRQIKFRAWHIKDKCYCESVSCGAMSIVGYDIHEIFNNDIILEQFTGLCDKDGVEIYEGDMVEYCHWDDCQENKSRPWKTGTIEWCSRTYRFHVVPETPMNSLYSSYMYKVVGNIHEGKE